MQCDVTISSGNSIDVTVNFRLSDEGDTICEATDTLIPEIADATIVSGVDTTQIVSGSNGVFSASTTISGENAGGPFVLCCTGKKGGTTHVSTETIDVTVTAAGNAAPQITKIFSNVASITLNEGPSNTNVTINFSAVDTDGFADLDDASASLNLTRTGETARHNGTACVRYEANGDEANYSCTVNTWWFDESGAWTINASIVDSASNEVSNGTETININTLTAFVSGPGNLTWTTLNAGETNRTSGNDPLVLNNTGNQDIAFGNIDINATNLTGETTASEAIYSGNFSVGNFSDANFQECAINDTGPGQSSLGVNATQMNITSAGFISVAGAVLPAGNFTVDDGTTGQEELFFCILLIGSELSTQSYSATTNNVGSWTIRIVLVAISTAGSAAASRARRKKKRKKKKDDKLIESLDTIIGEMREMKLIMKELGGEYKISKKEIIEILEQRRKENIPSTIFTKELGGLEALVKYMKENLGMSYHEIAEKLARDDRTIWTSYKKATEKQRGPIEIKETDLLIPISILNNRKLTILESVVIYLKTKGIKNSEIAKLLDRDQRNIGTIYSRAVRKLREKEKG